MNNGDKKLDFRVSASVKDDEVNVEITQIISNSQEILTRANIIKVLSIAIVSIARNTQDDDGLKDFELLNIAHDTIAENFAATEINLYRIKQDESQGK